MHLPRASRITTAAITLVVVAAAWLGAVGLVRAPDAFARLHFVGPPALLGPAALAAATLISLGHGSPTTVRAALVAVLMATTGPIVAHATARAARLRSRGSLEVRPGDAGATR